MEPINTCCGRHGGDSAGCGAGGGRGSGGHTPPPRGQAGHGDTLHTAQDTVHAIAARVANFNRPAGFFINFGRPKLAKIKNVQKIRVFPLYLDALRDN